MGRIGHVGRIGYTQSCCCPPHAPYLSETTPLGENLRYCLPVLMPPTRQYCPSPDPWQTEARKSLFIVLPLASVRMPSCFG